MKGKFIAGLQTGQLVNFVPRTARFLEAVFHFVLLADGFDSLNPLKAALHGKGPFHQLGVAHAPALHPLHGKAEPGDFFVLPALGRFQLLDQLLFLVHIIAVIARVTGNLPLLQLQDALSHPVQEIPVVRDDQHRPFEGREIILQPFNGMKIQMVGGLVQQKDIGIRQNHPGQVDSGLFPAGKAHKGPLLHSGGDIQAVGHSVVFDLQLITSRRFKGRLQPSVSVQVLGAWFFCQSLLQLTQLTLHLSQLVKGLHQHLTDRDLQRILGQLVQQGDSSAVPNGQFPVVEPFFAGQDIE